MALAQATRTGRAADSTSSGRTANLAPRAYSWLLVATGLAFAGSALAAGRNVGIGRDEAVYLSQVSRFSPPAFFSAPRARGITWIVAPAATMTHSTVLIRDYLALLAGAALIGTFWPWLRVRGLIGPVVPLAAGLFACLWVARFYAPAAMPNLWVAFGAVAAVGFLVRLLQEQTIVPRLLLGLAAAVFAVALLRPTDALILGLGCALVAVFARRSRGLGIALAAAVAILAGLVPWVVEAERRFGGVAARLRAGAATEGGLSWHPLLGVQLKVMDGPLLCRPCRAAAAATIPGDVRALWLGAAAAVALALIVGARRRELTPVLVPSAAAAAMAAPYLLGLGYAAPRFLLPTYALAAIPIARGLTLLPSLFGRWARLPLAAVGLIAFVFFAVDQQSTLDRIAAHQTAKRAVPAALAASLRAEGIRSGCVISGRGAPTVAYALGCQSSAVSGHDASTTRARLRAEQATTGQVVLLRGPDASTLTPKWATGLWRPGYRFLDSQRRPTFTVFLPNDLALLPNNLTAVPNSTAQGTP